MAQVTKFLLNFRNNLRPHEKRYNAGLKFLEIK